MKSNKSLVQVRSGWDQGSGFQHTHEEAKWKYSFCKGGTRSETETYIDETQKTENKVN